MQIPIFFHICSKIFTSYLRARDGDHGVIRHLSRFLLGFEEGEMVGGGRVLLDKYLPPGELLLELDGPGHFVHAHKGGVVEGVRVKLQRRLGAIGVSGTLQQSSLLI